MGKSSFSEQFRKLIHRYKRYNLDTREVDLDTREVDLDTREVDLDTR